MTTYTEQWPNLSKVTENLDPELISMVGRYLDLYPQDVQDEYNDYQAFCLEYSDWLDNQEKATYNYHMEI
jgi:hypothetical protein